MPAMPGLTIQAGAQRFEVEFTAPSLTSPTSLQFRYRLDGFDEQWVEADSRRQAIYTNLPPRPYVFRVEARDPAMGSLSSAMWAFSVAPSIFQTVWFYVFLMMIAVLIVGGVWRLRLRIIRKEFALLLGERVRLSRQIHDTLLQSLVGVSLQLDQLGHDIESTANGRDYVVKLRKQVDEYIRDAKQAIWNLRSSMLGNSDLATALRNSGERLTAGLLSFDFMTIGSPCILPPGADEQLLRVGQEAITNAVRHSGANHVSVELVYEGRAVTLRITDDGHGFNASESSVDSNREQGEVSHWGVAIMRERIAAAGGKLSISSVLNAGTIVEASIPLRFHASNEQ
jgi:signal transduction histidine kinase